MKKLGSNWTTVILVGSLWGFLEATLGGFLHMTHLPIAGKIMAPIGFALMFWGLKNGLKVHQLITVSIIAAAFKFLDPFLFAMPFFHIKIINPAQAIVMQGLCFSVISSLFKTKEGSWKTTLAASALLYPASVLAFSLFSLTIVNYFPGPLEGGISLILLNMAIGTAITMSVISLVSFSYGRLRLLNLTRFSLAARLSTAAILIVSTILARGLIG